MVEDRVTDGTRVGQLLASELTGLESGPLAAVSVADADSDAVPAPDGTEAFGIEFDGERVGRVVLFPASVAVELDVERVDAGTVRDRATEAGLVVSYAADDRSVTLDVESGASVKRAVDALVAGLERERDSR